MTRFAIDAGTAIRIARDGTVIADSHKLVAPNRLMSDALATLYARVRLGEIDRDEALAIMDGITTMGIRLLGDRVSRAVAWRVAEQLGWDEIGRAEYLSVAQLQADALITDDPGLSAAATVRIAPFADLEKPASTELSDYIAAAVEPAKSVLTALRARALAIAPGAEETTSYGMPALRYRGRPLIAVITTQAGYSVYPFSPAVVTAAAHLTMGLRTTKGGIAFTDDRMLGDDAFDALVRGRLEEIDAALG